MVIRRILFITFFVVVMISTHSYYTKTMYEIANVSKLRNKTSFEGEYTIHFVETNKFRSAFTTKQLCAVESAARNNPNAAVIIHSLKAREGEFSFLFDSYPNLFLNEMNLEELFNQTPLLEWHKRGEINKSEFGISHLSDATRITLLFKFGGVYSDLDTITLKSFESLLKYNGAGYLFEDGGHSLGCGVLVFQVNHPFLEYMIKRLASNYDPKVWGAAGPLMLIASMKEFCKSEDIYSVLTLEPLNKTSIFNVPSDQRSCGLTIFPQRYFYPLNYREDLEYLFKKNSTYDIKNNTEYSVHFYGKMSEIFKVKPGDNSIYDRLAASNCKLVYNHVKSKKLLFE